jgi:hypothetical protein
MRKSNPSYKYPRRSDSFGHRHFLESTTFMSCTRDRFSLCEAGGTAGIIERTWRVFVVGHSFASPFRNFRQEAPFLDSGVPVHHRGGRGSDPDQRGRDQSHAKRFRRCHRRHADQRAAFRRLLPVWPQHYLDGARVAGRRAFDFVPHHRANLYLGHAAVDLHFPRAHGGVAVLGRGRRA